MSTKKNLFLEKKRRPNQSINEESPNNPYEKEKEEPKIVQKDNNLIENVEEMTKNKLKTIISISQYFQKKISEDWKSMQISDLKKYCESTEIFSESNFKLLNELLDSDLDAFIQYYPKYQFTLTLDQRKLLQKKIKDCDNIPNIRNNYIKEETKSIRDLFIKISNLILDTNFTDDNCIENLVNQIKSNGVFINDNIEFFIPVNFGKCEIKFNKLIIDLVLFIFGKNMGNLNNLNDEEKELIIIKISQFKESAIFYQKSGMYNDETLFKICDYLINCYYILNEVDDSLKDFDNLRKIISCCLPFELDTAINFIKESKIFASKVKFEIDDIIFKKYNPLNLNKNSRIKLTNGKITIEAKAEDINWALKPNIFFQQFNYDNFTLCFRFHKFNDFNYINLDGEIKNNYQSLIRAILKSKTMEECMNIDSDARKFKYPFSEEVVIKEIEEHTLFVPFPAKNFYGYSDKTSFTIYMNSSINSSNLKTIFIDFDNLSKSKFHEIKHIYRLYMHINEPSILLRAPEIKKISISRNKLLKDNIKSFKKNEAKVTELYNKRIIPKSEINYLDYGDVLEFAINGDKQDVFFIKNSLFCLAEESWKKEPSDFFDSYFESCHVKKFTFRPSKDEIFIKSVMKFFNLPNRLEITNEANFSKRASHRPLNNSFEEEIDNFCVFIPRANHCTMKK